MQNWVSKQKIKLCKSWIFELLSKVFYLYTNKLTQCEKKPESKITNRKVITNIGTFRIIKFILYLILSNVIFKSHGP